MAQRSEGPVEMPEQTTQDVFQTIDLMRPEAFAAILAEDARLVFGNAEPLAGRQAIIAGLTEFFSGIKSLRHRIVHDWHVGGDVIAETKVTYRRLDDKEVSVPAVSIWQVRDDGLIGEYRIFVDLAPLFAT